MNSKLEPQAIDTTNENQVIKYNLCILNFF